MNKFLQIIENYPTELKLLIACCGGRWNTEKLRNKIDQNIFLQLVKRHRVNPFIFHFALQHPNFFPLEIQKIIFDSQQTNSKRMLGLSAEMMKLQNLFKANGIINIPIKGPALAFQIYNDPGMRHSMDLDFLVLPKDLDIVASLMIDEGYKQIKPDFPLSPKQQKAHKKLIHHYYFKNVKTGLLVEIHWKLTTPSSLFLNSEKLFFESLKESHPFSEIKPELLLHYLIVHGSMHRWYKLFWLKDIDEFFRRNIITDIEYFNKLKIIFRDEKMVNQNLALAELLFDTPISAELKPAVYPYSSIVAALKAIQTPEEKLHKRTLERAKRLIYLIRLKPGLNHLFFCLKAPGTNYLDWKTLPLPDSLFFMYYPLRPFLWLWSVFIKKIPVA
jgi:hypothetical protein